MNRLVIKMGLLVTGALCLGGAHAFASGTGTPFEGDVTNTSGTTNHVKVDAAGGITITPVIVNGQYTSALNETAMSTFMSSHNLSLNCGSYNSSSGGSSGSFEGGGGGGGHGAMGGSEVGGWGETN